MKRLISAIIVITLMLGLTGCREKIGPAEQVKRNLDEIKTEEINSVGDVFNGDDDLRKKYEGQYIEMYRKMQEFDYEIVDSYVDDEAGSATVTVRITNYDFGQAYRDAFEQAEQDAADQVIDSDTDVADYLYGILFKKVEKLSEKNYKAEVPVNCVINDAGDWEADISSNEELQDAFMGGYPTAIKEV